MGIERLFGKQKIPHALFSNYPNDICPPLCDEYGNIINFKRLTATRPCKAFGFFEFVIRQSDPYSIYMFHYKKRKSYDDYTLEEVYNCQTKKKRNVHHNCIARNENCEISCVMSFFLFFKDLFQATGAYVEIDLYGHSEPYKGI